MNNYKFKIILIIGISFYLLLPGFKDTYTSEKSCPKPYIKTIYPKTAKQGEKIKIRGNRFGNKKGNVIFSPKINATILKWTNRKIWVIVPKSSESGPLTVSSSCGAISNKVYFTIKQDGE